MSKNILKKQSILVAIFFCFLAAVTISRIISMYHSHKWENVSGQEYFWIAQNISQDEGFSFKDNNGGCLLISNPISQVINFLLQHGKNLYILIWLDLYLRIFLILAKVIVLVFSYIFFFFTLVMMYLIISKIYKSHLGIISVTILMFLLAGFKNFSESTFSPAIFAGFMISASNIYSY